MSGREWIPSLAVVVYLLGAGILPAHDIPNERVDRSIGVVIEPGRLRVEYEVSLTELTLARDLKSLGETFDGADRDALFRRYGEVTGPLNARGFVIELEGRPAELEVEGFAVFVEEHPRFVFELGMDLPEGGRLSLRDGNYVSSEGTSRLALRGGGGVGIEGYEGPAAIEEAEERPDWMLSDSEEAATRGFVVLFRRDDGAVRVKEPESVVGEVRRESPSEGLSGLLRTRGTSWVLLWFLAVGLGAAHSIQPGHGKAMVAAAALGSSAGWRGGLVLALATTAAHLASVLVLAGMLGATRSVRPADLHGVLTQGIGFVIAVLGVWRLGRHLGGHGEHGQGSEGAAEVPRGWRGLVMVGLAAGAVPCWDAVVLILLAEVAGALGLGIWLLTGFSVGMAGVLVGVGVLAGRFRRLVARGDRETGWTHGLGIVSGLVLTGIGLYLWLGL